MRLAAIGHTYAMQYAQAKFVAMKAADEQLHLRLIVPKLWRHMGEGHSGSRDPGLSSDEVVHLATFPRRADHMRYGFDPLGLFTTLHAFRPTHVLLEEDPHSVAGFQVLQTIKAACPAATLVLFTWDNVNRQPRQPLLALKSALWRTAARRTSMVVCGNAEAQGLLEVKGYQGRSCVLPQLAVPTDLFEADHRAPSNLNRIGYVGRLVPEKGLETLFAALSQLLDVAWTLTIVGDGPLRTDLERLAQPWAARVQFTGALPQSAVPGALSAMDIFVLPSEATARWKEQFGYALALAMMAGKVVIGSTCGAIPEVIGSGGLVVPERDPAALAIALRRVMNDPVLRDELRGRARQEALARYSPSVVASGYLAALADARL